MSEVKRIFTPGFNELPGCGDRCWSSAIDVDQWGARIEVYGMTSAEATELRDEVLRSITDFDAQRLRADTAEAELKRLDSLDTMQLIAELTKRNAAAEHRIAEQALILEEMATEMTLAISDSQIRAAMTVIGRVRFLQLLQAHNARVDAALSTASPATINQQGEEA